jgi:hypothetical protein
MWQAQSISVSVSVGDRLSRHLVEAERVEVVEVMHDFYESDVTNDERVGRMGSWRMGNGK